MLHRWANRTPIIFVGILLVAFLGLLCSSAGPFRSVSAQGVSASEANARLWNCLVPVDATDVWYTSSYRATKVECTIGQESFEGWCREHNWSPTSFDEDNAFYVNSLVHGPRFIKQGLRFDEMRGDVGFYGVFDIKNRRAYLQYSGG